MASDAGDRVVVELTLSEAMTVLAAVRQYEPYWRSDESLLTAAEHLAHVRQQVEAVIAKIRLATAG